MIKLVCFLKRKDGWSHEEFIDHWKNRHGPLITGTPNVARHVARYEQLEPSEALAWMNTKGFDGITIMWFNEPGDFEKFLAEPDYATHIAPDEQSFLDLDSLVGMLTEEPRLVIDGPAT